MNVLLRSLQAETLKTRRTLAFWLSLLTPSSLVVLEVAAALQRRGIRIAPGADRWLALLEELLTIWALLALPLFITLETALLAGLEHANRGWKLIYAQPVPRWALLASKQIIAAGLVGLSMATLTALAIAGGILLNTLRPELAFQPRIPWREMLYYVSATFLSAWLIVAVHTWVALRSPSFVVANGLGIAATVAAVVLTALESPGLFPWLMPSSTVLAVTTGHAAARYVIGGVLGGVLFSWLANWELARREVC